VDRISLGFSVVTLRVVGIHRLAGDELRRASHRYGMTSPGREQRFRAAIRQAFHRIATAAEQCPPYGRRSRWVKPHRFPYTVYSRILSETDATVYAVAHDWRRPGYWFGRLTRP
jgi:hypothetical protein